MGLFSSSKKENKPSPDSVVDWHPNGPNRMLRACEYDAKTNEMRTGAFNGRPMWGVEWSLANFQNVLCIIDKIDALTEKIDKVLSENKELKERCAFLEKNAGIKR